MSLLTESAVGTYVKMRGRKNKNTTVMCELQVERALRQLWDERVLRVDRMMM